MYINTEREREREHECARMCSRVWVCACKCARARSCVCECVCMCVWVCVCVCVCVCALPWWCPHACIRACTCACVAGRERERECMRARVCVCVCVCARTRALSCECVCVCVWLKLWRQVCSGLPDSCMGYVFYIVFFEWKYAVPSDFFFDKVVANTFLQTNRFYSSKNTGCLIYSWFRKHCTDAVDVPRYVARFVTTA